MMWDFGGRGAETQDRSRSRSPNPAFPVPQTASHQSHSPNAYGYPTSSSYPPPPPPSPYSPYYMSHEYPSIPRSGPVPPPPHYPPPQVIHVIHHSSHHSSKHKHKKHRSYSNLQSQAQQAPMTHSTSYQSYQSAPVIPPPPQPHHVHFPSPSRAVAQPAVLHKPPPRARVHSQPTMPTAAHVPRPLGVNLEPLNGDFQYSKCTGRKKALCIGINYKGQPNELRGCVNDARNVRNFLIRHGGYNSKDIVLLTDDSKDARSIPTRDNMIQAMRWLVRHAKADDSLFFHYSGHGGQTPDLDGDEIDGFDEVIYPVDFKTKGFIVDDEMHDIMVKPLPRGCRLTGVFDACHSGTVLDLPYIYSAHGRLKHNQISPRFRASKATPADVISWSGCKDGQTSADTFAGGVAVGAMSHAFITAWTNKPHQSYQELLRSIRLILHPRFSQRPQLGSSHHIDTNLRFVF